MNLEKIVEYMKEKHKGQKRKQGTPYHTHPIAVSKLLREKGFYNGQIAGNRGVSI